MRKTLISLALVAVSFGASATIFGTTDNSTTANGGAGGSAAVLGSGNSSAVGHGGAGGAGGHGGSGGSAAVLGSGNSSNANTNRNDLSNAQQQQQQQGQAQSSRNSNSNRNTSASGSASTSASSSGGNTLSGGAMSTGAVNVSIEGDAGSMSYHAAPRREVATAYAAPLAASNGTCMGSTSAGAQGAAFGVSFGSTWTDDSCDIRYDAEALRAAGMPVAARARLCQKPEIAKAMEDAGTPCPGSRAASPIMMPIAPEQPSTVRPRSTVQPQHTDPIIRKRLGLPPL